MRTHSMVTPFSVDNLRAACRREVSFCEARIEWRMNRFCVTILFICRFKFSIESVFISHFDSSSFPYLLMLTLRPATSVC